MRWIVLSILIGLFHASCDSVNTDQAEESALNQYQKTHTGTFAAETHSLNYWNSSLSISCTNENPVTFSFNNLNPAGVKNYYFNTVKDLPVSSVPWLQLNPSKTDLGYKVTGWSVPGSVNDIYTVHAWLKNSFNKGVYAGEANIVYDTETPVFNSVFNSASKTPTLSLSIRDLSLDPASIQITTGNHNLGDPGIACSGTFQLSEDNFTSCIPFLENPVFEKSSSDKFLNVVKIKANELAESTEYYFKIEGGISDCPGNVSSVSQTKTFVTADTGPPFIVSMKLSSNNSYSSSLAKPNDNIVLTFVANERLSETGAQDGLNNNHPRNSPKVDFWVKDSSIIHTVNAVRDSSDISGRTWIATVNASGQATWTANTSTSGDNISYRIYEYWDLAKDANLVFSPNQGADNTSLPTDGSYITYDNVVPTLLSPRTLLTTNANYSNMFKVGETAYIDFVIDNESVYTPTVNIGGFDNTTITGGPISWKAEYTYNDNTTPDNNSIKARIDIVDLAGNTRSYDSDNTIIFDKTIRGLNPVTIISDNPVRNLVQGGQTHHYAKLNDNITLEFESDETIIVHYVSIGIDNVSSSIIQPQDSDNKTWKVNYQISNSSLADGDLSLIINFTDLVSNDNYSVDLTTNASIIKYDKTAPQLDNVSIRSNNANKWMAKKNDTVTLEFNANENLKNATIQCYSGSVSSTTSSNCAHSQIHLYGDDNSTTLVTPSLINASDFRKYTTSRVFTTATPKTAQAGDNVTFTIQFEDYAGNAGTSIISSTTDNSTVTYDDQAPVLAQILITSDNINSSGQTVDKRLAMPGDNITLNFLTPEALDNLTLEFASETVSPTLVGDNYTFIKRMDDNDTVKTFNNCGNRITGCQVPFQIVSTDFAGNQSTENQTGTTDNSTVKFDGIKPLYDCNSGSHFNNSYDCKVNFSSNNCNDRAAKIDDNISLYFTLSEPVLKNSVKSYLYKDADNYSFNKDNISFSGLNGDLESHDKFSLSRKYKNDDIEGDISFYAYFTDPAGNSHENTNTTTDTSKVNFDRTPPQLTSVSVNTNNDTNFSEYAMSGTLVNVDFTANEELRRKVSTMGENPVTSRYNCTGTCCVNPYVVRKYGSTYDNISTMEDEVGFNGINNINDNAKSDISHRVNASHDNWTNGFIKYSNGTTSTNGDNFSFVIYYYDWAGNQGEIIYSDNSTGRYGLDTIIYDDVRPVLQNVEIKSDNWNNELKYVAKVDDNITLTYKITDINFLRYPPKIGLAQPTNTTYNIITPTTSDNIEYKAVHKMTASDIEGMVDFEIVFEDLSGNLVVVRQDNRISNNCFVPGNLKYHANNTTDCPSTANNFTWKVLINANATGLTDPLFSNGDNGTYYVDNASIQTTDKSFVIFDRTPPKPYLALTNPYSKDYSTRWVGNEKSVILEKIAIYFKDLTGILRYTDNDNSSASTGTYTGYDNFTGGYPSGGGVISTSNCNGGIHLTDNRSSFTECYSLIRVGKDEKLPNQVRLKELKDIHIRPSTTELGNSNGTDLADSILRNDTYLETFQIDQYTLDTSECPVRPSSISGQCPANLFPNSIIQAHIETPVSDLAGNIMAPVELGGNISTAPGTTSASFKTLERPHVQATYPNDGDESVFLNINPRITFDLPSTNFRSNTLYPTTKLNEEYTNNLSQIYTVPGAYQAADYVGPNQLDFNCLSVDNETHSGSISLKPYPNSGYSLAFYEEELLNTITIRPNGPLMENTKYTVTVNNQLNDTSFCRNLEKIAPLDNHTFHFTTVDNVTKVLIAHYTFDDISGDNISDHSFVDGVWQDGVITGTVSNGFGIDNDTNGSISMDGSDSITILQDPQFDFSDNFTLSVWIKTLSSSGGIINKSTNGFSLDLNGSDVELSTSNGTLSCTLSTKDDEWHHIAFTRKQNEQKLYLNGIGCDSASSPNLMNNGGNINIGSNFTGSIDELMLFKSNLGSEEIKNLFAKTGRKLVGYYPLGSRIIAADVIDYSGNEFHGLVRGVAGTSVANYEGKSQKATRFNGDGYVEVGYQTKLNPEKFTIVGWMKSNHSNKSMQGLMSSESSNKGYGLYRWAYRSYQERTTSNVNRFQLYDRNGDITGTFSATGSVTNDCRNSRRLNPDWGIVAGAPQWLWDLWYNTYQTGALKCRQNTAENSIPYLFEFWTRPETITTDTSGSGNSKSVPGFDVEQVTDSTSLKTLSSYDRTNNDSTIMDSKLILSGGTGNNKDCVSGCYPYNINNPNLNKWLMFIASWDGNRTSKVEIKNYFDMVSIPSTSSTPRLNSNYVKNTTHPLFIGHGFGDGNGKENYFEGILDDIRIYSRVLSREEIDTIFNVSDTEPPVPGLITGVVGRINLTNTSVTWGIAKDDVTDANDLEYKVVSIFPNNRITTPETADRNGDIQMNWTKNISTHNFAANLQADTWVTILVRDKAGNMNIYEVVKTN